MIHSSVLDSSKLLKDQELAISALFVVLLLGFQPLRSQDVTAPPPARTLPELAKVVEDLSTAVNHDPQNSLNYFQRGVAEHDVAMLDKVIATAGMNGKRRASPEQMAAYVEFHRYMNAALADFTKAIELNPRYGEAYHRRGVVDWDLINDGGSGGLDAKTDIRKALEIDPTNEEALKSLAEAEGDHAKSVEDYTKAIALKPNDAGAYARRAAFEGVLWHYDDALKDYARAIQLNPKEIGFYHERAQMEVMLAATGMGKWNDAIPDLTQEIVLNPSAPDPYMYRAVARTNVGDLKGALSDYDQKILLTPDDYLNLTRRGDVKTKLKDIDGAITDYNQVIKLVPAYTPAVDGLHAAEKIKAGVPKNSLF